MTTPNKDLCFSTLLDTADCSKILSSISWIPKIKKHFAQIRKFVSSSNIGSLSIPTTIRGEKCVLHAGWWNLSEGGENISRAALGIEPLRLVNQYNSIYPSFSELLNTGETNEQHVLRSQFVSQTMKNIFDLKYNPGYVFEVFNFGDKFICFNEEVEGRTLLNSEEKMGISTWKIGTPLGTFSLQNAEANVRLSCLDRNYANIIFMLGLDCEEEFFLDSGEINWDNPKLLSNLVAKTLKKGGSIEK